MSHLLANDILGELSDKYVVGHHEPCNQACRTQTMQSIFISTRSVFHLVDRGVALLERSWEEDRFTSKTPPPG